MTIEQLKQSVIENELSKVDSVIKICDSHIEKMFIAGLYQFFHGCGYRISLNIVSADVEGWNDEKLLNAWNYFIAPGGVMEFPNRSVRHPLLRETGLLCGLTIECFDIVYRVFPQFPIYDNVQLRFADFVWEALDKKGMHLKDYIIECDGFAYHSTREQIVNDNKRTRFLSSKGYTVIRYTSDEILNADETFFLNLENNIFKSIFKKNSNTYISRTV